jgi:hypothetical protein
MAITINGDTGLTLPASSSITGSSTTLTGITSVASNAADTPVILQDSSSNSATCRAWVNFNGTGTVAIRADFNVSSITDNNTGDYTVNFSNALPDGNYSLTGSAGDTSVVTNSLPGIRPAAAFATGSVRFTVLFVSSTSSNVFDYTQVSVAIFR